MYFRNRFSSASGKPENIQPQLAKLLADRLLVQDPDDRILAVHARHDRHAEVDRLSRHPELEASVLRDPLFCDVELGHDLDARDDRAVKLLGDRPHRGLQNPIDSILHVHGVIAGLDVNVAGAPLDRREDRRIDELDYRADIARQPLDGQVLVEVVVVFQQLDLKALGRLLEHALRAFAFFQDRFDCRSARRR